MFEEMKERVYKANMDLVAKGVVIYTWGNVSEVDREKGVMVIKPSGIDYDTMKPSDMVVVDLKTGQVVEGDLNPSSDTPTHLKLYNAFEQIGGITHTHSTYCAGFAQAGAPIPALGTTHADSFFGDVPCTRGLTREEVESAYEANTGEVIIETIREKGYDVMAIPAILVRNHGPFAWGKDAASSVYNAVVCEKCAEMAFISLSLSRQSEMPQYILDKHYYRKHGPNAYYGQKKKRK